MLYYSTKILKRKGLFKRERRSTYIRTLAVILYHLGLSFRDVSKILNLMGFRVSYEAVRNWYHRCKSIFSSERKRRRYIAIDEAAIVCGKRRYYIWVAVDTEKMEIISARMSKSRSNLDYIEMIMNVLEKCENKPVFIICKSQRYKDILSRRNLKYEIRIRRDINTGCFSFIKVKEESEGVLKKISI